MVKYDIKTLEVIFFTEMNKASLSSEYCEIVEEELKKTSIEQVSQDMKEIIKHFNLFSNHSLNKSKTGYEM